MTELGNRIKKELDELIAEGNISGRELIKLATASSLVEELDKNYEALRTAVLEKPTQQTTFNVTSRYDSKSGIVVGLRDEAARELGLRYGSIEGALRDE